jgi:hypothetical protein
MMRSPPTGSSVRTDKASLNHRIHQREKQRRQGITQSTIAGATAAPMRTTYTATSSQIVLTSPPA